MYSNRVVLLLALVFTFACAYGQDVHYNYDRSANFHLTKPTSGLPSRALAARCRIN
jgi:hypothetical protein